MPKIIKNYSPSDSVVQYELQDNLMDLSLEIVRQKQLSSKGGQQVIVEGSMDLALKQSESILQVARDEATKIKDEARSEGFQTGVKEGREKGRQDAYEEHTQKLEADRMMVLAQVEESIAAMEMQKQMLLERYLEDLKNLSIAISEKVMRVSLQSSGDIIKRMIVSATEKLSKTQWVKIYISKYDADLMLEGDAQLLNSLSFLSDNIKIITMDKEEQGTCIIELPKEIIDVSLNTQLENIKSILSNVQL